MREFNCEELFEEVNENVTLQEDLYGGKWYHTVVCTIAQGTITCGASYLLGNKGYGCTVTNECMNNCR